LERENSGAIKEKKATRHRGSKEAKDPDRWPGDPFEGLPCSAFVDLGDLVRRQAGEACSSVADGVAVEEGDGAVEAAC